MLDPSGTAGLIVNVLLSARYSIERSISARTDVDEIENAADAVGKIEKLRFPMQAIGRRAMNRFSMNEFARNLDIAGIGLSTLMDDKQFIGVARRIRFKYQAPRRILDEDILNKYPLLDSDRNDVLKVLKELLTFMGEVRSEDYLEKMFSLVQDELPIDALTDLS